MSQSEILEEHLSYVNFLDHREPQEIEMVVIHCTELPDLSSARKFGEKIHYPISGTGNSGHYYVDRDGRIEQWVPLDRVAHHVAGFNQTSIGIELVNLGRYPHWLNTDAQHMSEPYCSAQMDALTRLLIFLCNDLPDLRWICGHEHLDTERVPATDIPTVRVRRKLDPGPLFPWQELLRNSALNSRLHRYPG
jgi:N-acetylmuramoyl-L-alanine amidase